MTIKIDQAREPLILVADDEKNICSLLERCFKRQGYRVCLSANGKEAQEILDREEGINVAIFDLQMPELGGLELLNLIQVKRLKIPVIIITGQKSHTYREEAEKNGAFAYLLKPFELKEITRLTREALQVK